MVAVRQDSAEPTFPLPTPIRIRPPDRPPMNDPNETQIQYDLYRVPFNDGRGGQTEPIAGACVKASGNEASD